MTNHHKPTASSIMLISILMLSYSQEFLYIHRSLINLPGHEWGQIKAEYATLARRLTASQNLPWVLIVTEN